MWSLALRIALVGAIAAALASPHPRAHLVGVAAAAPTVHDVPLPPGTRPAGDRHASSLGFRATIDHFSRWLRTRSLPVTTIGPYAARGVDVLRFVREDAAGPWLAIHVYRHGGKTWIFVVPRPGLDGSQPTE